jgi:glycosyltransferase involved in cell wall biosynthesis
LTPRVAFFTDSFHETNGVALTSRQFDRFARESGYPFFSVHAGPHPGLARDGVHETYELDNSPFLLHLEHDLYFDLLFHRHRKPLREALRVFRPDIVHVTGPNHAGMLGAFLAYDLKVPLAASWHTNIHEYSERRLQKMLRALPGGARNAAASWAEHRTLDLAMRFYRLARVTFAPNRELTGLLEQRAGKPSHLMERGIDTQFYTPARRTRAAQDGKTLVGFVGRLSAEKNVRLLAEVERALELAGVADCEIVAIGDGSERAWLLENLHRVRAPGTLKGAELAAAYADLDIFAFPSETDTYGNVVWEALASGVPAVVTDKGGPKFLVEDGVTGMVTRNPAEFCDAVVALARDPERRRAMSSAGRRAAEGRSWSAVFQGVYDVYRGLLAPSL